MRRIENEAVAAIAKGDGESAQAHLCELLAFDRRRAWWALFRAAAAIQSDNRRAAMIALVSRAYIARRTGQMIGVTDEPVVGALAGWLTLSEWDCSGAELTKEERDQLARWLPARVSRLLDEVIPHPRSVRKDNYG